MRGGVEPSRRRVPVPIRPAVKAADIYGLHFFATGREFKFDSIPDFEVANTRALKLVSMAKFIASAVVSCKKSVALLRPPPLNFSADHHVFDLSF